MVKIVRWVAWLAVGLMTLAIALASVNGDFGAEGSALLDLAWGRVTLIDLYTGILLVSIWVWWREARPGRAALWIGVFVVTGNLGVALYVALAAGRAGSVIELLAGTRLLGGDPQTPGRS